MQILSKWYKKDHDNETNKSNLNTERLFSLMHYIYAKSNVLTSYFIFTVIIFYMKFFCLLLALIFNF